jgi:hypothetical protein
VVAHNCHWVWQFPVQAYLPICQAGFWSPGDGTPTGWPHTTQSYTVPACREPRQSLASGICLTHLSQEVPVRPDQHSVGAEPIHFLCVLQRSGRCPCIQAQAGATLLHRGWHTTVAAAAQTAVPAVATLCGLAYQCMPAFVSVCCFISESFISGVPTRVHNTVDATGGLGLIQAGSNSAVTHSILVAGPVVCTEWYGSCGRTCGRYRVV